MNYKYREEREGRKKERRKEGRKRERKRKTEKEGGHRGQTQGETQERRAQSLRGEEVGLFSDTDIHVCFYEWLIKE